MTLGLAGLELIKSFEDFSATAYQDDKGVWTLGYGTTRINGAPITRGMTCTEGQALDWLHEDASSALRAISRTIRVPLSENQVDALCAFAYNVGNAGFASSTLARTINAGQPVTEAMFTMWNKIRDPKTGQLRVLNGLTRRRKAEFALFANS
jgi:lysozyme